MNDERVYAWTVTKPGAVAGGPDGPIPVQPGDIVIVHVVKSWSEAAQKLRDRK